MTVRVPFLLAVLAAGVIAWMALRHSGDAATSVREDDAALPSLEVPSGFRIGVWAGVPGARSLALGPGGTVFVGTRSSGVVYALKDRDGDGDADDGRVILHGLAGPNGVAVLDQALYVGERSRIVRYDDIEAHLESPPAPVVVRDGLPGSGGHSNRYLAFGPDRRLYVGLGAPCNVCEATHFQADGRDLQTASLTRMDADGKNWEVVATGVRNTVGITFHPQTGEPWFTDNGRDNLGDDIPSCELNRLAKAGQDYGFPYCHQGDVADPEFGARQPCSASVPPAAKLGAHVAPLGVRFYTGTQFPAAYRGAAIVAEHGSWNRSKKSGYRVVAVHFDASGGSSQEVLVGGWMRDERVSGRPVDVLQLPDGSILISDDAAGRIWRLSYDQPA
jgi:glucose/arabinose dehydrogenase